MILHPSVIALLAGSLLLGGLLLYAGSHGLQILRHWDLKSGSELQLSLERKTYLISTVMSYGLAFQVLSLFLFIYTADSLSGLFSGAMCAAGSLLVNKYGYPALILKVLNAILSGLWLIMNAADVRSPDYPLIRPKYRLLTGIAPLILIEAFIQGRYFIGLSPEIITSCCGSLFSAGDEGFGAGIASLPVRPMEVIFGACLVFLFFSGGWFLMKGRGGYLFAFSAGAMFPVAIASLTSFISPYFYEIPTHHCPFCILQSGYGYIGYPVYLSLFAGTVTGMGAGMLMFFRNADSLAPVLPVMERRLALASLASYLVFSVIVIGRILTTSFVLES